MQLDKADLCVGIALSFCFGMLFCLWVTWDMPAGNSPRKQPVDYQIKYGQEVCKQRNADLHPLGKLNYYVCMDKTTKVLSDFD